MVGQSPAAFRGIHLRGILSGTTGEQRKRARMATDFNTGAPLTVRFSNSDQAWAAWLIWWFRQERWNVTPKPPRARPGAILITQWDPDLRRYNRLYVAVTRAALERMHEEVPALSRQDEVRRTRENRANARRTTGHRPARTAPRPAPAPPAARSGNRVFVSYSHKDRWMLEELQTHMEVLVRQGEIELWSDARLRAGDRWRDELTGAIQTCVVAILLISADSLASDFIHNEEVLPLLEAARRDDVRVIPVFVGTGPYQGTGLEAIQWFNDPDTPLSSLPKSDREAELKRLCGEVRELLRR
jgi:TIR domain